jgi:DNA-binding NarL/FixJ family response regulator
MASEHLQIANEIPMRDSTSTVSAITRVLVVDDHGIVREGLYALLEKRPNLEVVGAAATGEEAIVAARHLRPDVIIMDLVLPDLNGIDATQRILEESPAIRVIVLSARQSPEHLHRALRAGVRGYVVKAAAGSDLLHAIRRVNAGGTYVSPAVSCLLDVPNAPKSPYERLSVREREVLRRIVAGSSSADIAQHLSLSRKTIDTYRGRLMVKLGVSNRSALIRLAIENELTAS